MINIHIEIDGPVKSIKHLVTRVRKQEKSLIKLFPWFLTGEFKIPYLNFKCRWELPEINLSLLSRTYPNLTFKVRYEEPEWDLYGLTVYKNGCKIRSIRMSKHRYQELVSKEE